LEHGAKAFAGAGAGIANATVEITSRFESSLYEFVNPSVSHSTVRFVDHFSQPIALSGLSILSCHLEHVTQDWQQAGLPLPDLGAFSVTEKLDK
jgi:hypothetical protein